MMPHVDSTLVCSQRRNDGISVIIVNFNGAHVVRDAVVSVLGQTIRPRKIIVVDNASTDESRNILSEFGNEISLLMLDRNEGFAGGHLAALPHVDGQFVAVLNPDAVAAPEWLEESVRALVQFPSAGSVAPLVTRAMDGLIDSAGIVFSTSLKGFQRGMGESPAGYEEPGWVVGASGAAAVYRRDVIEKIGFFDRDFFVLFEDVDFSLRAQAAGWRCRYVPTAKVVHIGAESRGRTSQVSAFNAAKNVELVRLKTIPGTWFLRNIIPLLVNEFADFVYYCIVLKRPVQFVRGKWDVIRHVPEILKKRDPIPTQKRREISGELVPFFGIWIGRYVFGGVRHLFKRKD